MPITYTIDEDLELVRTTAWDTVTEEEWIAYDEQLATDPSFHPALNQLADFTQVTNIKISPMESPQVAKAAPFAEGSKRAAVASSDLIFGMGRVYEAHSAADAEIRIFRTMEEAQEWLGI